MLGLTVNKLRGMLCKKPSITLGGAKRIGIGYLSSMGILFTIFMIYPNPLQY